MTLLIAPARVDGAPPPQEFELHFYDGQIAGVQLEQAEFPVSQLTLEAWLKPGKLVQETFLLGETPPNVSPMAILFTASQPGTIGFDIATDMGGLQGAGSTIQLVVDEWSHIEVTYDGSEAKLFINGVLEAQVAMTGSVVFDEGIFQIGNFSDSLYHGAVRQVRLWKTARTQTQIIDAMDRSLSGTEVGLLHYWPLDDGSGPKKMVHAIRTLAILIPAIPD